MQLCTRETLYHQYYMTCSGYRCSTVFNTDDCLATYQELKDKGVQFVSEPAERPYGIEAVFKDNSGNWFSLTQPNADHQ